MTSTKELLREVSDLVRFGRTPVQSKEVIFYLEHGDYLPYYRGLTDGLDQNWYYLVSSLEKLDTDSSRSFFSKRLLPILLAFIDCKVLVMTMPGLNLAHIRRSIHPVHYVYVFHSPLSTHMVYRKGAFDYYDSILCVGPHQVREIRRNEEKYNLKPKKLVEVGFPRLEEIYQAYQQFQKPTKKVTVLVAPTWGFSNLFNFCGKELLDILLKEGYEVILRLNPETVKRGLVPKIPTSSNLLLETSTARIDSLVKSDILITDWSGISVDYAFGTERPVIFIGTPPKIRNSRYLDLGIEPLELSLRNKIGLTVPLEEIERIPTVIQGLLEEQTNWKAPLARLREEYVFNFGESSEIGANYIRELVNGL